MFMKKLKVKNRNKHDRNIMVSVELHSSTFLKSEEYFTLRKVELQMKLLLVGQEFNTLQKVLKHLKSFKNYGVLRILETHEETYA